MVLVTRSLVAELLWNWLVNRFELAGTPWEAIQLPIPNVALAAVKLTDVPVTACRVCESLTVKGEPKTAVTTPATPGVVDRAKALLMAATSAG